jgi:hypothetical protein
MRALEPVAPEVELPILPVVLYRGLVVIEADGILCNDVSNPRDS